MCLYFKPNMHLLPVFGLLFLCQCWYPRVSLILSRVCSPGNGMKVYRPQPFGKLGTPVRKVKAAGKDIGNAECEDTYQGLASIREGAGRRQKVQTHKALRTRWYYSEKSILRWGLICWGISALQRVLKPCSLEWRDMGFYPNSIQLSWRESIILWAPWEQWTSSVCFCIIMAVIYWVLTICQVLW